MDELQQLFSGILLTEEQVFALCDEYSTYAFYLGYPPELRKAYSSPLRQDDKPSFGIFEATRKLSPVLEFRWKDSALNLSGDIVDLVRLLHKLPNRQAALKQIDQDFELGLSTSVPTTNPKKHVYQKPAHKANSVIRIKSSPYTRADLEYWKEYGVCPSLLQAYCVASVSAFWTRPEQEVPFTPPGLCFAYRIGRYYKLYQPFNPQLKFLNNFPETYAEGYAQLPEHGELVVITKSTKDCMVLHSFGVAACAPRSESTPFPAHLLAKLRTRFGRVLVLFDNDIFGKGADGEARNHGQLAAQQFCRQHNLQNVCLPDELALRKLKDISDVRKACGPAYTQQLLTHLLA